MILQAFVKSGMDILNSSFSRNSNHSFFILLHIGYCLRPFRKHANPGVLPILAQKLGDCFFDIATGAEHSHLNHLIGQTVAININRGFLADQCLDLGLPRIAFDKAGSPDRGSQLFHTLRFAQ